MNVVTAFRLLWWDTLNLTGDCHQGSTRASSPLGSSYIPYWSNHPDLVLRQILSCPPCLLVMVLPELLHLWICSAHYKFASLTACWLLHDTWSVFVPGKGVLPPDHLLDQALFPAFPTCWRIVWLHLDGSSGFPWWIRRPHCRPCLLSIHFSFVIALVIPFDTILSVLFGLLSTLLLGEPGVNCRRPVEWVTCPAASELFPAISQPWLSSSLSLMPTSLVQSSKLHYKFRHFFIAKENLLNNSSC